MLPPLPSWEGLHPLVVHFPIALLLVVPFFVLLGLVPKFGCGFGKAALLLAILGTGGAWVSVASGEAAASIAVRTPDMAPVLARHAELAETARLLFTIVTLAHAAFLVLPAMLKRTLPGVARALGLILLAAAYQACGLVLANVGHLGGRLVHELGVHSWVAS